MLKTTKQIEEYLASHQIHNFTIDNNLVVNVDGDVVLTDLKLSSLPCQFGVVTKSFDCSHNELRTLKGAPYQVGGYFMCSHNQLSSLEYGPNKVKGSYIAHYNQLTSLEFVSHEIGGDLIVCQNQLKNLLHCPNIIPGYLNAADNKLETLLGCAQEVGSLHIANNKLENFQYIAKHIHQLLLAQDNPLTTLDDLPEICHKLQFDTHLLSYDFSNVENNQSHRVEMSLVELRKVILEYKLNMKKVSYKRGNKI